MANDWKQLFRYKSGDTYQNIYNRAYRQMKMAQQFNKSALPAMQRALANAKMYFDSKKKAPVKKISHMGGYISNKNRNTIARRFVSKMK